MNDFPFLVKCTSPRVIKTVYGEHRTVPCGKCKTCLNSRSSRLSLLCQQEASRSRYTFFTTLKFTNDCVSCMAYSLDFNGDSDDGFINISPLVNDKPFSAPTGDTYSFPITRREADFFTSSLGKAKNAMPGYFTFTRVSTVQKFLKRVRKYIHSHNTHNQDESLRYFIVSEYGPVTLRTHLHCLFFTNSDFVSKILRQAIYSSWTFGSIDFSLSRGGCASYCSGYVNSSACLPPFYRFKEIQPFVLKSIRFGFGFDKDLFKSHTRKSLDDIFDTKVNCGNMSLPIVSFASYRNALFPRCYQFGHTDRQRMFENYTLYQTFSQTYGLVDVIDIRSALIHDFLKYDPYDKESSLPFPVVFFFDYYFNRDSSKCLISGLTFLRSFGEDALLRKFDSIASMLYLSKHFLEFCCCSTSPVVYFNKILEFYSRVDYDNLTRMLSLQETYFVDSDLSDLAYFYDGFSADDAFLSSPPVQGLISSSEMRYYKKIKHKESNELALQLFS